MFYLEGGLETTQKCAETREKTFYKTSFQLGKGVKKVQKQGRHERKQEDYPTSAVYFCRSRVVFLRSFISALSPPFFRPILNSDEVLEKLVFLVLIRLMMK